MYIPKQFEEPRVDVMHELIRARPLATLVTLSSSGLNANHIPLHLLESPTPFGTLQGHVARANPILSDLEKDMEVLAVFHGPDTYITPSWYATKKETGKVVPTWNYAVVHAYGYVRVVDDAAWLRAHLEALTTHNEASFSGTVGRFRCPARIYGKTDRQHRWLRNGHYKVVRQVEGKPEPTTTESIQRSRRFEGKWATRFIGNGRSSRSSNEKCSLTTSSTRTIKSGAR